MKCRQVLNKIFSFLDNNEINVSQSKECIKKLLESDKILGVVENKNDISDEIKKLIEMREVARKNKNWSESDRIRDELNSRGLLIEDTPEGTTWKFK